MYLVKHIFLCVFASYDLLTIATGYASFHLGNQFISQSVGWSIGHCDAYSHVHHLFHHLRRISKQEKTEISTLRKMDSMFMTFKASKASKTQALGWCMLNYLVKLFKASFCLECQGDVQLLNCNIKYNK